MVLSSRGKEILDNYVSYLSIQRPHVLRIAFARGLNLDGASPTHQEKGWEIPDIFSEEDLLLFKHLLIHKLKRDFSTDELTSEIVTTIEQGLRNMEQIYEERNTIDDLRMLLIS
jgi:hypothetical protein